jgi:hypothetical protein
MSATAGSPTVPATLGSRYALNETQTLALIVLIGGAIRLYLSLTSYCISGDGAAYINMAREFAAGDWRDPVGAVFSPLYPLLIAGAHRWIHDWELAGNLVSTILGTTAIAGVYLLMREVFGRGYVAIGAAALTAIHPDLAAYAASVRTEAGYICLTTIAVWLLLKAVREERVSIVLLSGLAAGSAYLYRTEAIGLVGLGSLYPLIAALGWRRPAKGRAIALAFGFAASASMLVLPYMTYLHAITGGWSVGREFTAAMMFGLGSVSHNAAAWRRQGFALDAAPLHALATHPRLYLVKVRTDLFSSFYDFVHAAGPVLTPLLAIGCWYRGRRLLASAAESFLALIVIFYFCGFVLSYTGARFMIHLIPYTLGWVIIGLAALTGWLQRVSATYGWRMPPAVPATMIALILLPQTLWPIGYDMRGVRYAGSRIASDNHDDRAVVARDGRVAWYAGARFVGLPITPAPSICGWLAGHPKAGYVLLDTHDEREYAITPASSCLRFMQRYPRYGKGYYDLFAIRPGGAAH